MGSVENKIPFVVMAGRDDSLLAVQMMKMGQATFWSRMPPCLTGYRWW